MSVVGLLAPNDVCLLFSPMVERKNGRILFISATHSRSITHKGLAFQSWHTGNYIFVEEISKGKSILARALGRFCRSFYPCLDSLSNLAFSGFSLFSASLILYYSNLSGRHYLYGRYCELDHPSIIIIMIKKEMAEKNKQPFSSLNVPQVIIYYSNLFSSQSFAILFSLLQISIFFPVT